MPERNCENCGQVIGNFEESYSYYGRVICRACMIRLENLFQAPGTTNGDSETEASTAEVRTQKDSVSEGETPLTENRAATELSHETVARKEDSPDSQTLKNALASSEQKETPRTNRRQLKVLWVGIGLLALLGPSLVIFAPGLYLKLRDNRPTQTTQPEWSRDDSIPVTEQTNRLKGLLEQTEPTERLREADPLDSPKTPALPDLPEGFVLDQQVGKEEVKRYTKAAEQGDADAQFQLGASYHLGQGVPQDYKEAVKWYRKAAEQGYAEAQHCLALMYGRGEGVLEDYVEAYKWHLLAAMTGNKDAQRGKEYLRQRITPSQIEEAQRRAKAFMARQEEGPR